MNTNTNFFSSNSNELPSEKLMRAASNGDLILLQESLDEGAEIDFQRVGVTALSLTMSKGHFECAIDLIAKGANVNTRNEYGWRPIHEAVRKGRIDMIEMLIENGSLDQPRDKAGWTPLRVAVEDGQMEVAQHLIIRGQDVNLADADDKTPLMIAVEQRKVNFVKALMLGGANPLIKDVKGQSAIDRAAAWENSPEMAAMTQGGTLQQGAASHQEDGKPEAVMENKAEELGVSRILKRKIAQP